MEVNALLQISPSNGDGGDADEDEDDDDLRGRGEQRYSPIEGKRAAYKTERRR